MSLMVVSSCTTNEKFNGNKWKAADGENITSDTRSKMVTDLLNSELILGKTEEELITLLGPTSNYNGFKSKNAKLFAVQEIYTWDIDPSEFTFIKVVFDDKGKAKSAEFYSSKD